MFDWLTSESEILAVLKLILNFKTVERAIGFMMDSAWEILGLQPGCPESDLKRAYARLLKLHRPDQDPEGFRRIRRAYEFLRATEFSSESIPSEPTIPISVQDGRDNSETVSKDRVPEIHVEPKVQTWRLNFNAAVSFAQSEEWQLAFDQIDEVKRALMQIGSAEIAAALIKCAQLIALLNDRFATHLGEVASQFLPDSRCQAEHQDLAMLCIAATELQSIPFRERSTLARCIALNAAHISDQKVQWAVLALCEIGAARNAQAYFHARFPHLKIREYETSTASAKEGCNPSDKFLFKFVATATLLIVIIVCIVNLLHQS